MGFEAPDDRIDNSELSAAMPRESARIIAHGAVARCERSLRHLKGLVGRQGHLLGGIKSGQLQV
jgi:hypothetical protein